MSLKILLVTEKNSWVDIHIAGSLEDMGHTVKRFYYGNFIGEFYGIKRRNELLEKNKQLVELTRQLASGPGLDLIFCYVQDDFLLPKYANLLAKMDIPFVNYNVDMACQWYRQTHIAKYFTYLLCAQPDNIQHLARYNSRTLLFPMAARKSLIQTTNNISFQPSAPVTFLGTPTTYRMHVLSILHSASIPLAIYGKYWKTNEVATPTRNLEKTIKDIINYSMPKFRSEGISSLTARAKERFTKATKFNPSFSSNIIHDFLPNEAVGNLFINSQINLGFTRIREDNPYRKGLYQMRLRDFEVPFTGGFYLVEAAPGYNSFFTPDKEVVTWETPDDLQEKITYYLTHEDERNAIAMAGQKRALAQHTWEHRFNMLFDELGIN